MSYKSSRFEYSDMSSLVGLTFNEVIKVDTDQIKFIGEKSFVLAHIQECCECVDIEDINGDLSDLEHTPIISAVRETNNTNPKDGDTNFTWTFFRISTIKGTVVIRFYGESNGYYSEDADLLSLDESE